jgi:hypothetical protein
MNITNSQFSNHRAGTLQSKGYVAVMVTGNGISGAQNNLDDDSWIIPASELDHVNQSGDDNRIEQPTFSYKPKKRVIHLLAVGIPLARLRDCWDKRRGKWKALMKWRAETALSTLGDLRVTN